MRRRSEREVARPVFVDGSGRRRRLATVAGVTLGAGLLLALVLVVAGLFGTSPVGLPGLPGGQGQPQPGLLRQAPPQPQKSPVPGSASPPAAVRGQPAGSTPTPTAIPTPTAGADVNPAGHPRSGPSRSHPGKQK
jgi:hypothetical protein